MKVINESLSVLSDGGHPTFHDITEDVKKIFLQSKTMNGICTIYSHHTTCSVIIQECSHDKTYLGLENLQQDLCTVMEKIIPTCRYQSQYLHPGPEHIEFSKSVGDEPIACLNTDAHLRSSIFGRSETVIIENGVLDLGDFGHIYFIDWDQIRARERVIKISIIGE